MLTVFKNILQMEREETQFIHKVKKEMDAHKYSISKINSNKKILTIIACHCNTVLKYNTIINNIKHLHFQTNDIIVVNSKNEQYSAALRETLEKKVYGYIEIPNNNHLDIGKWCHVLSLIDTSKYSDVVFTNDSFIITSSISHFFNKMIKSNVELYGYNDSSQECYHYQSYLFGIKEPFVYKLQNLYSNKKHLLTSYIEVVKNIELNLVNTFSSSDCFLKFAYISSQKTKNIFFNNDTLYKKLLQTKVLPFIKIKRILS
jgi:hypothetical protein